MEQQGQEIHRKTYKFKKGEYVCKVEGRVGCVVDELKFYTSFGRKFSGNDDSGDECKPEYVGRPYVFGFDFHFHHLIQWYHSHQGHLYQSRVELFLSHQVVQQGRRNSFPGTLLLFRTRRG